MKEEFDVKKYDPHYFPERPSGQFDVVFCNYVQQAVIDDAMSFVKPGGYGYFVVRRDRKKLNGWTSRQTFQRLVELSEDDGFQLWAEKSHYAIYQVEFKEGLGVGVLHTEVVTFHRTPQESESPNSATHLAIGMR